ncbi:MAG TPA: hypothetical protein VL443_24320 [Cyclobacteriaceae bacterium]|jgi:hypothetical protein|nr:hypothetical protein [Cyclobacteriaceae bacterium]
MAKENLRKTMEQVLENAPEPEINQEHVNDWHTAKSAEAFKTIHRDLSAERIGTFNIRAAISAPKSIKYRQMAIDWEGGNRGDYIFMDASGNKMILPYKLFKRLF